MGLQEETPHTVSGNLRRKKGNNRNYTQNITKRPYINLCISMGKGGRKELAKGNYPGVQGLLEKGYRAENTVVREHLGIKIW